MSLFSKEHNSFRASVRSFVEQQLAPHADDWEQKGAFPVSLFRELGRLGWLGLTHPRKYGGQDLDFGHSVVLAEELPRSKMMGLTLSVLAQANILPPLLARFGTEDQKQEFLIPILRGDKIGALASTEPSGGSDIVRSVRCTAAEDGDFWVLSGEKKFITNAPIADFVVTLARTRPEETLNSLSLIIVPTDTPGFRIKATLRKLGMHTSPTGWLSLSECRVPKRFTVGKPHLGYHYMASNILEERLVAGASAVSLAGIILIDTVAYLQQRIAYGKPLSELQAVRHQIADLAAGIEMARRFVHSVCESYRDGNVEAKEICMVKLKAAELIQATAEKCLQLHGGSGFLEENWITRVFRDARMISVGGGPSELMKDLIAGYIRL
jgi:citronellyl-CoA dehydrogenase